MRREGAEEPAPAEPVAVSPGVGGHAPDAGSLDVGTIRRSWQQLLDRLLDRRQMILHANLGSATAASYDGTVLELAFPPGRTFAVAKVQEKEAQFQEIFAEVFGVKPKLRCVARDHGPGGPVVDEDPPTNREDAVARLKSELADEIEAP